MDGWKPAETPTEICWNRSQRWFFRDLTSAPDKKFKYAGFLTPGWAPTLLYTGGPFQASWPEPIMAGSLPPTPTDPRPWASLRWTTPEDRWAVSMVTGMLTRIAGRGTASVRPSLWPNVDGRGSSGHTGDRPHEAGPQQEGRSDTTKGMACVRSLKW